MSGLDIVRHVPHVCGLCRIQSMLRNDLPDHGAFVYHAGVGLFEVAIKSKFAQLLVEIIRIHAGEHKEADAIPTAPLEELSRARQGDDRVLR